MTEKMAIELRGALKQRRRRSIGPIDLNIPQGYIVALVGTNGSGKSTMMNMMLKTIKPDQGTIRWYGESYSGELPLILRQSIGYVPEIPTLEENRLTADVAARFRSHWYPNWDEARFNELMDKFHVPRNERLNRMSKGERRKFEIAAVLASRPKLLLLDEPSSGLDPFAWGDMIDELQACMENEEVTIVLSTHIVDEVKRLADYIVLVNEGQVLGVAEKDSLYGTWKELWVQGVPEVLSKVSGVAKCQPDGPTLTRIIVRDNEQWTNYLAATGTQIVKSRTLELEEILRLWIEGHEPEQLIV
ncbi:ABC transporter ATP-binding protein [Paenibacillus sp. D2_2]|uniref:ABC transporter ATP-binding protein n=1 Tax=Paenibacillus sp. D2_2 TaxID=3073092 RepID=UPI0028161A10|nr:ABC transporter ATP-binding protein [Paenibacillus sp. D2_2]WMT41567.1 ABC transporter ATP-binding protein [Paenibacillus sp. D2_2]